MVSALFGAMESGLIYAVMALGVYLTFRILDFPDLTVDGSFVTGGAVTSVMIVSGISPVLATIAGGAAGFLAGCVTGLLHTKGKINSLLAGILMMIALYSINLRIMGRPNIPLLNETTALNQGRSLWDAMQLDSILSSPFKAMGLSSFLPTSFFILVSIGIVVIIVKKALDWFLHTDNGLALRATGDNAKMVKSFSANTSNYVIFGLGLSNALVAFSGSLIVQYNGFADVGLGIGMIIVGLASVIIGEGIFGKKSIARTTLAVVLGAIVYRVILAVAMQLEFVKASDLKLITAIIVTGALVLPNMWSSWRERSERMKKQKAMQQSLDEERRNEVATAQTD
ncbi:ABC transporter permease [Pontibacillus yanchengensis]|uniref:ABC transporter permease n=2 Tax=Pontibacillus yanchengensis TaxID=462910 RepID=A0ACC7VE78_9BACI|nr:ABC transporter permease [Pontibacillus yanchengensis]MYL32325.1 ABC transporter permease [Pontibacillus yanchengensis]MYL52905.1 ABC transporter permease [Pontibacillus yanchengensis]